VAAEVRYFCLKKQGGKSNLSPFSSTAEVATAMSITEAFAYIIASFNLWATVATTDYINRFFCTITTDFPACISRNARMASFFFEIVHVLTSNKNI